MFEVGDVIVCVDDRPSETGNVTGITLRRGAIYRISACRFGLGRGGILVDGEPPHFNPSRIGVTGWKVDRFRKIDEGVTEEFRQSLRKTPARV